MRRLLSVVGARPQFVKAAPVSRALARSGIAEVMVHTGQHYDVLMSDIFFEQLDLTPPAYHLAVGSGSHAYQTGEALQKIEAVLIQEKPEAVLVYGDTNATLAGALAAAKLNIPVAHVEAGLRSFNRRMPEEVNRVLCDHMSTWLFAPTAEAVRNLQTEGIAGRGVQQVGDVMLDAVRLFEPLARKISSDLPASHGLQSRQYWLLTLHRAETTQSAETVRAILRYLESLKVPILFPVHPRIRPLIEAAGPFAHIRCIEPLGYLEMLVAQSQAALILTDSGGMQKEAAFLRVPCVTLREETEWVETVAAGWNTLVGLSIERLAQALAQPRPIPADPIDVLYGDGQASAAIARLLADVP